MTFSQFLRVAAPAIVICSAIAADTTYRDPQGRFSLTLAAEWKPNTDQGGVQFMRGRAYITVLVVDAQGSPQNMASSIIQTVGGQWKNFQAFEPESVTFGGRPGVFAMARGANPQGVASFFACYAAESNGKGYLMLQSGPVEEMKSLDEEMGRIAMSVRFGAADAPGTPAAPPASSPNPLGPLAAPAPGRPPAAAGTNYDAPNGSLSMRVPQGWRARETTLGTTPVQVIEPESGDERILVAAVPAMANSIQELAQQTAQQVTQQVLPGFRLTGQPAISNVNGSPAAELKYTGTTAAGQVYAFQKILLKGQQSAGVLGMSRPDRAAMIEELCRGVFQSIQLRQGETPKAAGGAGGGAGGALAQHILGHWVWSHQTDTAGGRIAASTTRELWIYPGGRYKYVYATYVPNMPSDIDPVKTVTGSYRLEGNQLIGRADSGEQATFTVEAVGSTGMKLNGDLYIRQ